MQLQPVDLGLWQLQGKDQVLTDSLEASTFGKPPASWHFRWTEGGAVVRHLVTAADLVLCAAPRSTYFA